MRLGKAYLEVGCVTPLRCCGEGPAAGRFLVKATAASSDSVPSASVVQASGTTTVPTPLDHQTQRVPANPANAMRCCGNQRRAGVDA